MVKINQKLMRKLESAFPQTFVLIERLKQEKDNPNGLDISTGLVNGVCEELGLK